MHKGCIKKIAPPVVGGAISCYTKKARFWKRFLAVDLCTKSGI